MLNIISDIVSLSQYIFDIKKEALKPERCPYCGKGHPWNHGHYDRKVERAQTGSSNPVPIQRYFCPHCTRTCSILPEFISPRRWYIWLVQQWVMLDALLGKSLNQISQTHKPSRSTCRRWFARWKEQFLVHATSLRAHLPCLGRYQCVETFWPACLEKITLAKAMLLCHQQGVIIP